jgi:hypothetical protein
MTASVVYGLGAGYLMALVVHSHQCHLEAHRGEAIEGLPTTEDKAREIAHGPIQGYIGQGHEVIDMKAFFAALVQALREAKRTSA